MKIANPGQKSKLSLEIKIGVLGLRKSRFNGIGNIRDVKNDKNFYTKFTMKPEAVPVTQKP